MDVINTGMKLGKYLLIMVLALNITGIMFAGAAAGTGTGPENITKALGSLCATMKNIVGIALVLMIILAAITYAVGQVMGAETRARASVWATAMFTGALFAAVIFLIVPYIIGFLIGAGEGTDWVNNCCVADPPDACFES